MGRFEGLEETKIYKTGQYFKPGKYKVEIEAVKWVTSSKEKNKEFVVIETKVLASNNPETPVGCQRSQVINMSQVMGMPNFKAFLAAVSGVDSGSDGETLNRDVLAYWAGVTGLNKSIGQIGDMICSDVNPLNGETMDLECRDELKKGKKEGDDNAYFTKHLWGTRDVSAK